MKNKLWLSVASVTAAGLLAACGAQPTPAPTAAPPPAPTTAPAAPPAAPPAAQVAAAGASLVKLADSKFGKILVDDKGMTLYMYTKDTPNESVCYNQCETNWPVLFSSGTPKAGEGVNQALLGLTTRKDGQKQVTYNGMPLYYYVKDKAVGDIVGQDVGQVWYVVSADGKVIK